MATKNSEIVLRETQAVVDSKVLLETPVDQLDDVTATLAWSILDELEKKLTGPRKKDLRARLLQMAEFEGEPTVKGSFVYSIPEVGAKVVKQRRSGKVVYDPYALREIIDKIPNITAEEVLVPKYEVDEKKLEALVELGYLGEEELRKISRVKEPTYALVVNKPPVVKKLLRGRDANKD